jgi:hypothetical protein
MTWNPNPTVIIDGISFTNKSLWNVSVSYGRTTIWEQARAGYATISILNANNQDFGFDMNHDVTITVEDSNGDPVTLFTGKISNVSNGVQAAGTSATVAIQTITALSTFAQMARSVIGDTSWSKEFDDDRMTRIFTDAGVTIDTVDTPPVYEFTARSASPADAYSLASTYASMAFGYIYETPSGSVGFANESRRFLAERDNGYFNIPKDYILFNGLQSQKTLSDIMNSIIISYKANATKTASDATSIANYNLVAGSVSTELENGSDAQVQADRYITLRAYPRTSLSSFTIQLDSPNVTDADLDELLNISMDTAIEIDNLPLAIKNTTYQGFVEGWTFNINNVQVSLTFDSSDVAYSVTPTRWQDVDAALIWNAVDPAVTWDTFDDIY